MREETTTFRPDELKVTKVLFRTGDDRECRLYNLQDPNRPPKKGPVLMVAGVGVRANVFRPPGQDTLVDCLLERGYDVWLEDWRACIEWGASPPAWPKNRPGDSHDAGLVGPDELDRPPPWPQDTSADKDREPGNVDLRWCMDHAALYDHPQAVETVARMTGAPRIKAVIHCIGSVTFMMSAVAGLLPRVNHIPRVSHIVSNAVSLHPVVPTWTYLKSFVARPVVNRYVRYLDAQWGSTEPPPNWLARFFVWLIQWAQFECLNPVCKLASFSYGVGLPKLPVLWRHENLRPEIHEWIRDEFGKVLLRVFEQLEQAWKRGHVVPLVDLDGLPEDYTTTDLKTNLGDTRVAFFAGELNACFLKESQERTFDLFNRRHRRNYHSLHILPGYGHLDMFIGKDSAMDVFPLMLMELEK